MNASLQIKPGDLEILSDQLAKYLPGVQVWAYGSRVSGRPRPGSDIDLVVFTPAALKARVIDLRDALEESNITIPVDLHIWDELPETFRANIQKEHVSLRAQQRP